MFSKKLVSMVSIATAIGLTSCGLDPSSGTNPASSFNLNGNNYSVVTPGNLLHNGTSLSGTGAVVFNAPLSQVKSNNSYRLTFSLSDSGKLELVANSTNQLASGVTVRVQRVGDKINVTTVTNEETEEILTGYSSAHVNPTAALTLQIDLHNGHDGHGHVMIWDSSVTDFQNQAPIITAEPHGTGAGQFWGLNLENAVVTAATLSGPKFEE